MRSFNWIMLVTLICLIQDNPRDDVLSGSYGTSYRYSLGSTESACVNAASVWEQLEEGNLKLIVKIAVEMEGADTDLYVAKHPVLFPSLNPQEWSPYIRRGFKDLDLGIKGESFELWHLYYSCLWLQANGQVPGLATSSRKQRWPKVWERTASSSSDVEIVDCRNCKHWVPSRSITSHEVYCSRHNVVCNHPGCVIALTSPN